MSIRFRVFFSAELNGEKYDDLFVDVKQAVGSSYETGPIEVSSPRGGYRGRFHYGSFQKATERYYRSAIGTGGFTINIGGGRVWMRNNRVVCPMVAEFEASRPYVEW
jgi:hypothetical protein